MIGSAGILALFPMSSFLIKWIQVVPVWLKLTAKSQVQPPLCPYLSSIHDSAHTHRQGHGGHLGEISIKEPSICQDGVHGQRLHTGPGHQTGSRLVEGDVSVRANACPEETRQPCQSQGSKISRTDNLSFPTWGLKKILENHVSHLIHLKVHFKHMIFPSHF